MRTSMHALAHFFAISVKCMRNFLSSNNVEESETDGATTQTAATQPDEAFEVASATFLNNSKAKLTIGATARLWLRGINWTGGSLPLDLRIIHPQTNKSHTPHVQRLNRLQKQMAQKMILMLRKQTISAD